MTVPTQPVTVRLADFGGASVAGVRVTAKLSDFDYTVDGTFVGTEPVSALTDATGTAVLYVFPNQLAPDGLGTRGTTIKFSAAMPGSKSIRVDAVVPNHACDLVDILVNAEAPPFTAAQLFEQRANNAAALAEARMPVASDTPPSNPVANRLWFNTTNGKTYQWFVDADGGQWVETSGFYYVDDPVSVAAANAERLAAETARTGSETAKTGSETARTGAETAKSGADTAKAGADAANAAAQAAKTAAEAARDTANTSARAYTSSQGTAAALADAGVAVGQTFSVVAADGQSYDVYRKDAGPVATPMFTQYTKAYLDTALNKKVAAATGFDYLWALRTVKGYVPFAVLNDSLGTVRNAYIQQIEANATEARKSYKEVALNTQNIIWAVLLKSTTAGQGSVAIGVRADGRIVNPSFDALWNAVFGGASTTGDLSEADTKILLGKHLFCVEGRPFTLYGPSMLPTRNRNRLSYLFALQSINSSGVPIHADFDNSLRVDPASLGTTATVKLRNASVSGTEWSKSLTVVKSAAAKAAAPRVLMIGDSITAGSQQAVADKFTGMGVTPAFIGSRRTAGEAAWGEGRGGWRAADFVYINTQFTPLPAGSEATALALQNDQRNPFVRATVGGDDASMVKNGFIFDFANYLTRFGFATPALVTINLGTNDIQNDGATTGLANTVEALRIMVAQIKAAAPAAKIGLALPMPSNSSFNNPLWYAGYVALFLQLHQTYGADPNVFLLNTHARLPDAFVFPTTISSTDAQTGVTKETINDGIHFTHTAIGLSMYAEAIFSFIHAAA